MTTIFCSAKLSKLLKIQRKELSKDNVDMIGCWNAHLFYLKGKKFLIFVHKETLYSLIILDFRVDEFKKLHSILYSSLIFQLKADEIYSDQRAELFRNHFTGILFSTTDNDRKVIGTINEYILQFSATLEPGKISAKAFKEGLLASYMNEMPMGGINFNSPIEQLNQLLEKNAV